MSYCPKCGRPLEPGAYECPGCGIILAKYKGPHPADPQVASVPPPAPEAPAVDVEPPTGIWQHPVSRPGFDDRHSYGRTGYASSPTSTGYGNAPLQMQDAGLQMQDAGPRWGLRIGLLLGAAGLIATVTFLLWPTKFPSLKLEPAAVNTEGTDPCAGRRRCVVVVVAPWCGACKVGLPMMKELAERWSGVSSIGFKAIVGLAPKAQCEKMAEELGGQTFLDPMGRLMRTMGESTVPHWFVVDPAGKLKHHSAGLIPDTGAQIERLGLSKLDAENRPK